MNRDPYLPSPEICDWLLSLEWSDPVPLSIATYPKGGPFGMSKSRCWNYVYASATFGADAMIGIKLPEEAFQVLKRDADARRKAGAANHANA